MSDRKQAAVETLEFVTRSPSRVRILELLHENGDASRESLAAAVDVVRTTLQRNLTGLAERGLIRERGRRYEITSAGSLVATGLAGAIERVDAAMRLRPVLERVPDEQFGFDIDRLTDATVVESTTANPYAPVDHHAATLADADHVRALLPAVGATPLETSQEAIESGATFEMFLAPSVAETVRTEQPIADEFAKNADAPSVSVSVVDDEVPYYLGIVDDAVQIGVHDDSGLPTALLESTDDQVREWAVDRIDAARRRSTPFEFDGEP